MNKFILFIIAVCIISIFINDVYAYPVVDLLFQDVIEEKIYEPLNIEAGLYRNKYITSNEISIEYVIKIPQDATTNMPIIIWLHGIGELKRYLPDNFGLIKAANDLEENRFIILQPQTKRDWSTKKQYNAVIDLIDMIIAKYQIDTDRIILTGHSLGAIGTWYYAEKEPEKWAAIIPVSSRAMIKLNNLKQSDISVWAFCCSGDVKENTSGMKRNIEELLSTNSNRDIRYTKIKGTTHNKMSSVPYTKEFFDWAEQQIKIINEK